MVLNCRNGFVITLCVLLLQEHHIREKFVADLRKQFPDNGLVYSIGKHRVMNHYVKSLSPLQIVRDFICMFEFCDIFCTYHRYVDMVHTE